MSSNDLPETSPAHQTYLAAKRRGGREAATQICIKHGSKSGSFPDVPSKNLPAALIDLQALADSGDNDGIARASSKPLTMDGLQRTAMARWNNRSNAGR